MIVPLAPDVARRDVRRLYTEAVLYSLLTVTPSTFLSIYALRLGASSDTIGLLTALPALVNALWLVPSARLINRQPSLRRLLLACVAFVAAQFGLLALLPFVPPAHRSPLLLTIVAAGAAPSGMYVVLINTVLADTIAEPQRLRVLTKRSLLLAIGEMTATFGGGWFLSLFAVPVNYQLLLVLVGGLALVNALVVSRLAAVQAPRRPPAAAPGFSIDSLRRLVRGGGENRVFLAFVAAVFVATFGGWLPRALFSLYWVRVLNVSDTWVGIVNGVYPLAGIVSYPLWWRLAQRWSSRTMLLVGSFGLIAYPLLTGLAPSAPFLLAPAVVGGFMGPPYVIGLANTLLDLAPQHNRPTYMALYTAVTNMASFTAPIIATGVLLPLFGIKLGLFIGAAGRVAGWLAVLLLVKRPASA